MTLMDYLESSYLYLGVNCDDLKIIRSLCYSHSVKKGTEIFEHGEKAEFLYVLGKGRVALNMTLERPDGSTTPPTTVSSVGPGDAFGTRQSGMPMFRMGDLLRDRELMENASVEAERWLTSEHNSKGLISFVEANWEKRFRLGGVG